MKRVEKESVMPFWEFLRECKSPVTGKKVKYYSKPHILNASPIPFLESLVYTEEDE